MFRCGCVLPPPLGVGWRHCNVHDPTGPRCPWCLASPSTAWTTTWLPTACMATVAFWTLRPLYGEPLLPERKPAPPQGLRRAFEDTAPPRDRSESRLYASAAARGLASWATACVAVGFAFKLATGYPAFFVKL